MNSTIFLRAVFDSVGLMAASSSARMIGIGQEYINDRYSGSLARGPQAFTWWKPLPPTERKAACAAVTNLRIVLRRIVDTGGRVTGGSRRGFFS
jgi:hypothetical protein